MSASLVGSEMCIRDSRRAFPPFLCPCLCPCTAGRRQGRPGAPARRGPACLLYTSDAADDM
eukprot:4252267-Alexandrium_andersonii.AAC.1